MTEWIKPGQTVMVMGPNFNYVGRIVSFPGPKIVELADASWVSESGRLSVFIAKGKADNMDIEPVGRIACSWNDIIDWPHPLFKEAI